MAENKLKTKDFIVWSISILFFLYEFFLRTVTGSYQNPLMQDLNISALQFSLMSSTMFVLLYGSMQIPVGFIISRIGIKKSLLIGTFFCAVSSIGFSYSPTYACALTCRMVMGFGASFGFMCVLMVVQERMPRKHIALFIGLSQFIGTLGPMLAAGPLHTTNISWRPVFIYLGLFGAFLVLLVLFLVENTAQHKQEKISFSFKKLFSNAWPWYIALISTGLYIALDYLSANEGRTFLALKGITPSSAAYMISLGWAGYAIGCPLLGFLSDKLNRKTQTLQLSAILGFVTLLIILYAPSTSLLHLVFFLLGISASGLGVGLAMVSEQTDKQLVVIGFGLTNAMISITASINAPLIGLLLDSSDRAKPASLSHYLLSFTPLLVMSAIALVVSLFFIKKTYLKPSFLPA
ncbi:MFS transporter [Candidatus Aerophobetes bacterium]|uniref:Lysosomal dipeptide transporter MFSD1 n=1 Tax=Aerophobetes bacterium TaxID=2030807 RepID=A0A2A4WY41_UNCAE|nr:MAG: MFS transporter [Candidatus Aerophobetes bacterium]